MALIVSALGTPYRLGGIDPFNGGADCSGLLYWAALQCVDANGNLYVADTQNHLIRMVTPGGVVSTIAGTANPGHADGIGTAASFNTPFGICVDAQGVIYVADTDNNTIRKIVQQ